MKVIAVVGSASNSGKTRLVCAILRALPGLGAVKISPREGEPRVEWEGGAAGKDTARFAASGAAAVARIVAPRESVAAAWDGMRGALASLPGIVVEGAGALACAAEERFTIFIAAPRTLGQRPERDERLAAAADCLVVVRSGAAAAGDDAPLVARHRGRIPVHDLAAVGEEWPGAALLASIRSFLGCAPGVGPAEARRE